MSEDKNNSASQSDWKKRELGALWRREGKVQKYLSGVLKFGEFGTEQEIRVVVFTNKGKAKNEKAPDFIVYQDQPREALVSNESSQAESSTESVKEPVEAEDDVPEMLQ